MGISRTPAKKKAYAKEIEMRILFEKIINNDKQ